jgi:hypothetical protein
MRTPHTWGAVAPFNSLTSHMFSKAELMRPTFRPTEDQALYNIIGAYARYETAKEFKWLISTQKLSL